MGKFPFPVAGQIIVNVAVGIDHLPWRLAICCRKRLLQNDQSQILSFRPTLVFSTHPCRFDPPLSFRPGRNLIVLKTEICRYRSK